MLPVADMCEYDFEFDRYTNNITERTCNNSKCMINLTKKMTLLSLKTDMFQLLQLPSSEWYKTE